MDFYNVVRVSAEGHDAALELNRPGRIHVAIGGERRAVSDDADGERLADGSTSVSTMVEAVLGEAKFAAMGAPLAAHIFGDITEIMRASQRSSGSVGGAAGRGHHARARERTGHLRWDRSESGVRTRPDGVQVFVE